MKIQICKICSDSIERQGKPAFDIWSSILDHLVQENRPMIIQHNKERKYEWFFNIIKYLENKRYIISTECSIDCIQIRPLGIWEGKDKHYLCYHIFDRKK